MLPCTTTYGDVQLTTTLYNVGSAISVQVTVALSLESTLPVVYLRPIGLAVCRYLMVLWDLRGTQVIPFLSGSLWDVHSLGDVRTVIWQEGCGSGDLVRVGVRDEKLL